MPYYLLFLAFSLISLISLYLLDFKSFLQDLTIWSFALTLSLVQNFAPFLILFAALLVLTMAYIDSDSIFLLVSAIIGLIGLAVCDDLLLLYLFIELTSLPFYVLAARERAGMLSSEAGVKYFILGALSSAILLLGITIVYAEVGHTNIFLINNLYVPLIIIAILFKFGAAPFHMWVPDVYDGAPTIVSSLFAIVPKFAFLFILVKFNIPSWLPFVAALSIAFPSVAAINQSRIKRLLAYSAISHVGFLLLAVAANSLIGFQASFVYLIFYALMSFVAWSIVLWSNYVFVAQFAGLSRFNPVLAFSFAATLLSFAGVPPFAGFFAKYLVLSAAVQADFVIIPLFAVLASVLSAFVYIRLIVIMFFVDKSMVVVNNLVVPFKIAFSLAVSMFLIISVVLYPAVVFQFVFPLLV